MGYFLDKAKSMVSDIDLQTLPMNLDCEKSVKSEKSLSRDSSALPKNYCLKYPDTHTTDQELSEIEDRVLTEGYVLLRSNVLQDFVAFYKTEADRRKIPPGFVPYSDQELRELFGEGKTTHSLQLIHKAKKSMGAEIIPNKEDEI